MEGHGCQLQPDRPMPRLRRDDQAHRWDRIASSAEGVSVTGEGIGGPGEILPRAVADMTGWSAALDILAATAKGEAAAALREAALQTARARDAAAAAAPLFAAELGDLDDDGRKKP